MNKNEQLNNQQQIQEILKEAGAYGLRNEVEVLANSFLVDSQSAENKYSKFTPISEVEAYEIAYNLMLQE